MPIARKDPPVSQAQRRLMWATKGGAKTGVPKSVASEFTESDPGGKLPEKVKADEWSPEARKAAAEARKTKGGATPTGNLGEGGQFNLHPRRGDPSQWKKADGYRKQQLDACVDSLNNLVRRMDALEKTCDDDCLRDDEYARQDEWSEAARKAAAEARKNNSHKNVANFAGGYVEGGKAYPHSISTHATHHLHHEEQAAKNSHNYVFASQHREAARHHERAMNSNLRSSEGRKLSHKAYSFALKNRL